MYPPVVRTGGQEQNEVIFSDKVYRAEWGYIFRWSVPSDEMYPLVETSGDQEQN